MAQAGKRKKSTDLRGPLTTIQRQILRRISLGQTQVGIAQEFAVSPDTVRKLRYSKKGQAYLNLLQQAKDETVSETLESVEKGLQQTAPEALQVLQMALRGELDSNPQTYLRLKVAHDVLDRAGFVKPSKSQVTVQKGGLTEKDIEEVKRRALAAKREGREGANVVPFEKGELDADHG